MSCFFVSSIQIATVAQFAAESLGLDSLKTARALQTLNNASMRARYGDAPHSFGEEYGKPGDSSRAMHALNAGARTLGQYETPDQRAGYALALLLCIAYQCDNAPENHPAWKTLRAIETRAIETAGETAKAFSHVWSL